MRMSLYIYMCVCTWMVCAITLSFCFAERFVLYASCPLSLLVCVTDLSSIQSVHYYCWWWPVCVTDFHSIWAIHYCCWRVCDRFAARHADTSSDSTDGHSVEKRRTRLDVRVSQIWSCFSSLFCSIQCMNIHTYTTHTHQCKVNINRQNHVTSLDTRTKQQKTQQETHTP